MRQRASTLILVLVFSGCGKLAESGGAGLMGSGTAGSEKNSGAGAAHSLNLAHFPNVPNKLLGKWSLTTPTVGTNGTTYSTQMFFAQNEVGVATQCEAAGYSVTSTLAVSAKVENQTITIPVAGRHDSKSSDGEFVCTASILKGAMSFKVRMNSLTITPSKGGQTKVFTRLQY